MKEKIKEFHEKIGEILSTILHIESYLETFISDYYISPRTSKTSFFQETILLKFNFENKVIIFQKICKIENFDKVEIKKIVKSIEKIQKIRNKVAHYKSEITFEKNIQFKKRKVLTSEHETFVLDEKLMKIISKERTEIIKGIIKYYYKYRADGTFETRASIDIKSESWKTIYNAVKRFTNLNNKTPANASRDKTEHELGKWCNIQRQNFTKGLLNKENINDLENLEHWIWSRKDMWFISYNKVKLFIKKYKRHPTKQDYRSPFKEVSKPEEKLDTWIKRQRGIFSGREKSKEKLSDEKIKLLESLPSWYWTRRDKWGEIYDNLLIFISKNQGNMPKGDSKIPSEKKLGVWCMIQRRVYRGQIPYSKLSDEQINLLESLEKWFWGYRKEESYKSWSEYYKIFSKFVEKNKRLPNRKKKNSDDKSIVYWFERQKYLFRQNKLDKKQINLMENISFWSWGSERNKSELWMKNYNTLFNFIKDNNRLPNRKKVNNDDKDIVSWFERQKYLFRQNKLTQKKIELMENIPIWSWESIINKNSQLELWIKNYKLLIEFIKNNNRLPNRKNSDNDDKILVNWYDRQKFNYNKQKLSDEQMFNFEKVINWDK